MRGRPRRGNDAPRQRPERGFRIDQAAEGPQDDLLVAAPGDMRRSEVRALVEEDQDEDDRREDQAPRQIPVAQKEPERKDAKEVMWSRMGTPCTLPRGNASEGKM